MARRCVVCSQSGRLLRLDRLGLALAAIALALTGALAPSHGESSFPFGRELIMDVAPMKGSKRVPSLDIDDNGGAEIGLWCVSVKARLVVAADTVTVITGPRTEQTCSPEQTQRDEATLAALSQATHWRIDGDMFILSGGPAEMRFRMQTN
jgi:hypothetical protein